MTIERFRLMKVEFSIFSAVNTPPPTMVKIYHLYSTAQ